MFRADMKAKLERIFGLKRVTFNAPGETYEQDTLFVEIQECRTRATQGRCRAKVTGNLVLYTQVDKTPYGFFAKKLHKADLQDTKPFYFFNLDQDILGSEARYMNITERRCNFVFLYDEQYDPARHDMNTEQVLVEQFSMIDTGDGSVLEEGEGPTIGAET